MLLLSWQATACPQMPWLFGMLENTPCHAPIPGMTCWSTISWGVIAAAVVAAAAVRDCLRGTRAFQQSISLNWNCSCLSRSSIDPLMASSKFRGLARQNANQKQTECMQYIAIPYCAITFQSRDVQQRPGAGQQPGQLGRHMSRLQDMNGIAVTNRLTTNHAAHTI